VSAMMLRTDKFMLDRLADVHFLTALLLALHPNQRDQLQQHMHLSRAKGAAEAGSGDRVCQLWMQRLFEQRLEGGWTSCTQPGHALERLQIRHWVARLPARLDEIPRMDIEKVV
jgi:hypothetical protein